MIGQVGWTPLIHLRNIPQSFDIKCQVYAKCEFLNPTGSTTDRLVLQQFRGADKDVLLSTGHAVAEGDYDTCLSSAWLSTVGKLVPVSLPKGSGDAQDIPSEYGDLLKASGSRIIPLSSEAEASKIRTKVESGLNNKLFVSTQLSPLSVATAYATIGQEIVTQLGNNKKPSMIVCGGDNEGGILHGVAMSLRESQEDPTGENWEVPVEVSSLLSVGVDYSANSFNKNISGLCSKEKHVPFEWKWEAESAVRQELSLVDKSLEKFSGNSKLWTSRSEVTKWVQSSDAASYFTARRLAREEGLLVGPSAGAVMSAAIKEINLNPELKRDEKAVVVVILNNSLWKDSRDFLSDEWMLKNKYFKEDKMEALYWWYTMPLMTIKTDSLVEFPPEIKNSDALQTLRKVNTSKGIVSSGSDNKPLGVITSEMLEILEKGDAQSVGELCSTSMAVIDSRASISEVVPLLETNSFVLIVQKSPTLEPEPNSSGLEQRDAVANSSARNEDEGINNNNNNTIEDINIPQTTSLLDVATAVQPETVRNMEVKDVVLGILDTRDLLAFQRELEVHHEVSYGLILSDGIPSSDWYKDFE